jgi:hypothetical protein
LIREQTCVACGYSFTFDPAFYEERSLRPPLRCRSCRAERRARRRVRMRGVLVSNGGRFAVVRGNDDEEFVTSPVARLALGERVAFNVMADDVPTGGRRRVAYDVEPA